MSEVLRSLVIDNWYKALLVFSAVVFVLGLTIPLQIPNRIVLLAALGGFLHALGQWVNHPYRERIGNGFKISGHTRDITVSGVLMELIGTALLGWAIWLLVRM
jgi:hypothetical protein